MNKIVKVGSDCFAIEEFTIIKYKNFEYDFFSFSDPDEIHNQRKPKNILGKIIVPCSNLNPQEYLLSICAAYSKIIGKIVYKDLLKK